MKKFFQVAAFFDWATGVGLIFGLDAQVRLLGLPPPNYPGIFHLLGGITLFFGWIFWQVSKNPQNRSLFQAALLMKIVPFTCMAISVGFGTLPSVFLPIALLTDGLWIAPFLWFYVKSVEE